MEENQSKRNYIDAVKSVKSVGGVKLDITDENGRVYSSVEPHRLFPLSDTEDYIAIVDDDGNEQGVLRRTDELCDNDRKTLENALGEYYMIPKITKIKSITEKYGQIIFSVETDHGPCEFEIRNRQSDIKSMSQDRILIIDSSDNRYEIPDLNELDKHSRRKILPQL